MSLFKGCIDLHEGKVKQIVGKTLNSTSNPTENFTSLLPSKHYANLYKKENIKGSHLIKLGPNNDNAAISALEAWPHHIHIGGGITLDNANIWIDQHAAEKVIVTSLLFPNAKFSVESLRKISELVGTEKLVVDLSCKVDSDGRYIVAMDKWTKLTDMVLSDETIETFQEYTNEFLVHAADVEGLCSGIDETLVKNLSNWVSRKKTCVYAGGARDIDDLKSVNELSNGSIDLTFGSALDIFGGKGVKFDDLVKWNNNEKK